MTPLASEAVIKSLLIELDQIEQVLYDLNIEFTDRKTRVEVMQRKATALKEVLRALDYEFPVELT